MHVIVHTHAIQLIQHTHESEDKKQVQLELNMYFGKLMRMTSSTHLNIITYTMHKCVAGSTAPKKTMRMLADELDEGAKPMHQLQRRQEFSSARCHDEVHTQHHGRPILASAH